VSFTPRQLQKGDGLHKNGRLRDLFGVPEEALSGQELLKLCQAHRAARFQFDRSIRACSPALCDRV
jgi:hypothetical protein